MSKETPQAFRRRFIVQVGGFALLGLLIVLALRLSGIQLALSGSLIGEPSCLPYTFYMIRMRAPETLERGQLVVARMPDTGLGVGPEPGRKLVKIVSGLAGDHVRVKGTELYINQMHRDRLWLAKSLPGQQPGDFDRDQVLNDSEVFLLGSTKESYDSRYWGPLPKSEIVGAAYPLL